MLLVSRLIWRSRCKYRTPVAFVTGFSAGCGTDGSRIQPGSGEIREGWFWDQHWSTPSWSAKTARIRSGLIRILKTPRAGSIIETFAKARIRGRKARNVYGTFFSYFVFFDARCCWLVGWVENVDSEYRVRNVYDAQSGWELRAVGGAMETPVRARARWAAMLKTAWLIKV